MKDYRKFSVLPLENKWSKIQSSYVGLYKEVICFYIYHSVNTWAGADQGASFGKNFAWPTLNFYRGLLFLNVLNQPVMRAIEWKRDLK